MYVTPKQASEHFKVSNQCLRTWANQGKIKFSLTKGGHRRYLLSSEETKNVTKNPRKKLSTQEFQAKNKQKTLKTKLNSSKKDTQNIKSSRISTSIGTGSKGFWTEFSKEKSKKLWLPKKTVLQGLDLNFLNGFSKNTTHASFILKNKKVKEKTKNCQKTLWQSLQSLVQDTMEKEGTNETCKEIGPDISMYSRKIRFYPTTKQKELLNLCFGATRYLCNKVIKGIKNKTIDDFSFISLRKKVMLTDEELNKPENKEESWLKQIPFDTRQLALKRLSADILTNLEKVKKEKIKSFDMKFKTKKNPYQYCFVDKKALKPVSLKFFVRRVKEPFKLRKRMKKWWKKNIKKIESNFIIVREKNRYYFCLPMKKPEEKEKPNRKECVSLDPGVRTFQTFYSEENVAGKFGDKICYSLLKYAEKEDKLKSFLDLHETSKRHRYNLRKRCFLLRTKIKNITKDLHWKTCNWLCSNFENILLPTFNVKDMVEKSTPERIRKISSKTTRNMLTLSHYKFKEKLLYKGKVTNTKVHICNESYTTRTCGSCGNQEDIEGEKVFECSKCKLVIDRDYNGARNIYLKFLGDKTEELLKSLEK